MKNVFRRFSWPLTGISLVVLGLHAGAYFLIKDHGLMMDEHYHYAQIQRFLHGDFRLNTDLPMAPGYHTVVAGLAWVLGAAVVPYYPAVALIRGISWVLSLSGVGFFFLCARRIDRYSAVARTVLFAVFPLFFPFFSLLYTDLFSLSVLLAAVWLFLRKNYTLSSLVVALSVLIRQNNIIWGAFLVLWWYVQHEGYRISGAAIQKHLWRSLVYTIPAVVFLLVIWWFGGLASGAESQQYVKATIVVPENLFLLLFLYVPFFLPLFIPQGKQMLALAKTIGGYWLLVPFAYLLFHLTFVIRHPYNHGAFFIHNAILEYVTGQWLRTGVFFLLMVLAVLSIGVTRLYERGMYLLYPFTVLFLVPLVFVEQRYTMVPFAFFLLFRKPQHSEGGWLLIGWNFVVSATIFWGIFYWKFFW